MAKKKQKQKTSKTKKAQIKRAVNRYEKNAKKSDIYWKDRLQTEVKRLDRTDEEVMRQLKKYYQAEAQKMTDLIGKYYQTYGKGNVIEYRELLKTSSTGEKHLLLRDIEEFTRLNPSKAHLVNVRKSIYKLNRLESLRLSIELEQLRMAGYEEEIVRDYLEKVYENSYLTAIEYLGGNGSSFNIINNNVAKEFVGSDWAIGGNYSDRIYRNRDIMAQKLNREVTKAFVRGDSYERIAKQVAKETVNGSMSSARRLVRTEGTYILNEASIKAFEEGGFEQYMYVAVVDERTSPECLALNGTIHNMDERQPGTNFPPLHPNCRSTYSVIVPDDFVRKGTGK